MSGIPSSDEAMNIPLRPDQIPVDSPQPLSFFDAIYNAYEEKAHVMSPYGVAQDMENADAINRERMRVAGVADGDIPEPLNANDPALIGMNLRGYQSFLTDAMEVDRASTYADKVAAQQRFLEKYGDSELKLTRMQEKYPNAGILNRSQMFDQVKKNSQRIADQAAVGRGGVTGLAAQLIGAGAASVAFPNRDPISFLQAVAAPASIGKITFTGLAATYGLNFVPQFVNDLTGVNENQRLLGYDPTVAESAVNAAIGAAVPTALHVGGQLLRGLARRALPRRPVPPPRTPPEIAPAPGAVAAPGPSEPSGSPFGTGDFERPPLPVDTFGDPTGAREVTFRYAETPAERVRLAKDASAGEAQINEYGRTSMEVSPPTIDGFDNAVPTAYVRGRVTRSLSTTEEFNKEWQNISEGMTAGEAARTLDPQAMKKLDSLTRKLATEYEKSAVAKALNAELKKGNTQPLDDMIREGMARAAAEKNPNTKAAIAQEVIRRVDQKATGKLEDENAAGIAAAKQKLLAHMPLAQRAFARSNALWEVSQKMADEINNSVARHVAFLTGKPDKLTSTIDFTPVERPPFGEPPHNPYAAEMPELGTAAAREGATPGEPLVKPYERVQDADLKAQEDADVEVEAAFTKMIADLEDPLKEGQPTVVEIAGQEHHVTGSDSMNVVWDGEKSMTLKEAMDVIKQDMEAVKVATSCRTRL